MTRATLTAKMALTAKMRDSSRFMAWITEHGIHPESFAKTELSGLPKFHSALI
jgi:hypothetical protein